MIKRTKWGILSAMAILALVFVSLAGCVRDSAGAYFSFQGSDTEVNMVQRLTEAYSSRHPEVRFAVTGGGSGTGIAALINKQIDVANSSRPMSAAEIQQARDNGVEPVPFIFAQDGLSIIVHQDNPVSSLTLEQLGQIFSGAITNWRQLGGADSLISVYGRQSTSGTFIYFRDVVVKTDYTPDKKMLAGNAAIVEAVTADTAGIGYVGIGYASENGKARAGLKILSLATDPSKNPVSPLEMKNITEGVYPLVRPLFHYTNGTPTGALRQYLEFVMGRDGQAVVVQQSFFPITDAQKRENQNNLR